ncbi:tetratricopeptide repeat protein, partial [Streptomyces toxytricini]|uniref:tetratricopeptide repeat protein n=1 Tax=Streptomyces toxytricini TaxID=67369 RepID=UPI003449BC77
GGLPGLGHLPPARDPARRAAYAELLQVAAWITFDAERHHTSQRLHLRALEAARGGPDGPLPVEPLILAVLSMQEEHLGRPDRSLRIASTVLARPDLPGRVAAVFHVRAGRALARLGRGPQAMRSLHTASELLADPPGPRDPAWAWWMDRRELDGHRGLAEAALGRRDRAAELLHRAVHGADSGPAYRVLFAAELARVLAEAADWREADHALAALLDTAPTAGSVRALRAMARAARTVERSPSAPRRHRTTARDLTALLRTTHTPPEPADRRPDPPGPQTCSSRGKPVQRSAAGRWPASLNRTTAAGRPGA